MDDLVTWLRAQLDDDERVARAASGSTVIGEPGNWRPSPGGDEWEANATDFGDEEVLVALRPSLPRPPDVMGGKWGAVVSTEAHRRDSGEGSPMPCFEHIARHDPARVLAEVDAKRRILDAGMPLNEHEAVGEYLHFGDWHSCSDDCASTAWHEVIKLLALPYADRPGYRDEWKP